MIKIETIKKTKLEKLRDKKDDKESVWEYVEGLRTMYRNPECYFFHGVAEIFNTEIKEKLKQILDVKDFDNFINAYNACNESEYVKHDPKMYKKYLEYKKIIENKESQQTEKLKEARINLQDTLYEIAENTFIAFDKAYGVYKNELNKQNK